ncbi:MAG: T9SS type A sorting domain-containing protein [Putridiphycobacter sp.]
MKKLLIALFVGVTVLGFSQDQIKIMYYNLLNYPDVSPQRSDTLKTILHYDLPDVLVVNELETNTGANLILNNSLNQNGVSYYQKAAFFDGPDTDNGLFYNTNKLTLHSQQQITTVLRDISEYVMYYNDPNLGSETDTIFFYFYSVHLKAGTTEQAQRNVEITSLKNYLNTNNIAENIFIGGDFNFYDNTESGYLTILNSFNADMQDPINADGSWHNNGSYAYTHTQSTRTTDLGDGSTGGMDDRFDFIFASADVFSGEKGVTYAFNSYQAMGQDGIRFNSSINNPSNLLVPQNIATALMYMSDHLPVKMTVDVNYTSNNVSENNLNLLKVYYNEINQFMYLNKSLSHFNFTLYNIAGQQVFSTQLQQTNQIKLDQFIPKGIYLWQVETNGSIQTGKISL